MPFKFDSPEPKLLAQVTAELNELLSLEDLRLDGGQVVYWTPVYTMSCIDTVLTELPKNPVGWRFMIARSNLGGAVAGDFALPRNDDEAPATTGIYDGPAVDQALAALLHDWVDDPGNYQVRVLRISGPAVQALWLVPRPSNSKKTLGVKIVPYRTLAAGVEMRAYDQGEFFDLLKPLAKLSLQGRDL